MEPEIIPKIRHRAAITVVIGLVLHVIAPHFTHFTIAGPACGAVTVCSEAVLHERPEDIGYVLVPEALPDLGEMASMCQLMAGGGIDLGIVLPVFQSEGDVRQDALDQASIISQETAYQRIVDHSPVLEHAGAAAAHLLEQPYAEALGRCRNAQVTLLASGVPVICRIVYHASGEQFPVRIPVDRHTFPFCRSASKGGE